NAGSNDELQRLIADAQGLLRGVAPAALRDNVALRREVASELSRVEAGLDQLLMDRPRRRVLRRGQ
ncbi:MAG: hypothetical protein KDA44_10655, partial [Planctomycetales bacterium]|nr:hypothetical protein [Planctomycetales bacterium]